MENKKNSTVGTDPKPNDNSKPQKRNHRGAKYLLLAQIHGH